MSKREQRFSGHAWSCDVCGSKLKTETVVVLEIQIAAHVKECLDRQKKEADAARVKHAQLSLF